MSEKVMVFEKKKFDIVDWQNATKVWQAEEARQLSKQILTSNNLFYVDRDKAEQDESLAQVIPYTVLGIEDGIYFQYQRTKKGGEARLHDLWSVGIGGHINEDDTKHEDVYSAAFLREFEEEISIEGDWEQDIIGALYDARNSVGRVHFGIVHLVDIFYVYDMLSNDPALSNGGFVPVGKLKREKERFENWSQMVIEHLI